MRKNTLFISLTLVLTISLVFENVKAQTYPTFDQYMTKFGKNYSVTEKATRKILYDAVITNILPLITDYTPAVNNFTDWTAEELKTLKGLEQPQNTQSSNLVGGSRVGAPQSVDWRTANAVTTPKNQGRCGSCWAFAAVGYAESKLIIDDRYNDIDLSQQRILQCTKDSSCNGGFLQNAMTSVTNTIPFEFLYPYSRSSYQGGQICTFPGVQVGDIVQNYYDLTASELEDLVAERPIAISVFAGDWEHYGSGVFKCSLGSNTQSVNHAVLLIGYTQDYWIIKNSWGTNWGQNGYIRVSRTLGRDCKIGTSAHRTYENFHSFALLCLLLITLIMA